MPTNAWLLVRDAVKLPQPEGAPFPGAVLEKKSKVEHEEAPAGLVEHGAEHEVHEQVDAEHQAELLKSQDAGAEDEAYRNQRRSRRRDRRG